MHRQAPTPRRTLLKGIGGVAATTRAQDPQSKV